MGKQRSFLRYWKHYLKSAGIRKAHSPFIYQFYKEILKDTKKHRTDKKDGLPEFIQRPKYKRLLQRLMTYFKVRIVFEVEELLSLNKEEPIKPKIIWNGEGKSILVYFNETQNDELVFSYFTQFVENINYNPSIKNETILTFVGIHRTAKMERLWGEVKKNPSVRLTIDIFDMGFVFFKKEIKEKQHFNLRY